MADIGNGVDNRDKNAEARVSKELEFDSRGTIYNVLFWKTDKKKEKKKKKK